MIEVNNLVKQYGDHFAVKDLSFTFEDGKIYGFLGPNGAGKSTTMNIMTGYIACTSGEVIINGHDITEEPEEAKKCIGYLPEIPPLYVDMTVREYLTCVSDLKKIPKGERTGEVSRVMETVKITDMKDRMIKNLSKGYKQRVGIAQALIGSPEIIILDEPTVGLDPHQIIEIRELVRELGKKHTVIISSHILSEISEVCDRVLIIKKGTFVAEDSTENLEKMFQGSSTMQLLTEGREDEVREILGGFEQIGDVQIRISDGDGSEAASENSSAEADGTLSDAEMSCPPLAVSFRVEGTKDLRRELFFAFAKREIAILEMHRHNLSLEDIFLELTGNERSADAAGQSAKEETSGSAVPAEELTAADMPAKTAKNADNRSGKEI